MIANLIPRANYVVESIVKFVTDHISAFATTAKITVTSLPVGSAIGDGVLEFIVVTETQEMIRCDAARKADIAYTRSPLSAIRCCRFDI